MNKLFIKIYQQLLRVYVATFKIKQTQIIQKPDASRELGKILVSDAITNVLIVTDDILLNLGLLKPMFEGLEENNIAYHIYHGVVPNPTIKNIEQAKRVYIDNGCKAIIAFGGGSVIDCAKIVGVVALSGKPVRRYDFIIPMVPKMARLYAVPTTAGTGSEVTLSAVITDESRKKKMSITDAKLAPNYAILDANLMIGLPKHITAATGIDALTHAIEAYVGDWKFKFTDANAVKAVKTIFTHLETAHSDGENIEARDNMALAATYGGYAFRTGGIGYVHTIAHRLSELYGTPHGLANAIVLPHVLDHSFETIYPKLACLAKKAEIADHSQSDREIARAVVRKVKKLNKNLGIPKHAHQIRNADIHLIAKRAITEANATYPVPKVMNQNEMRKLLISIKGGKDQHRSTESELLSKRIEDTVKSQYAFFESKRTLPYRFRVENLKKLKTVVQSYEQQITEALKKDLGKHAFEAYATEISIIYTEINHAIHHLKSWMKPKRVGTPIASFGGVSKIYKQPIGVSLIMSPWNYPFQLALAPVVAAIAAGNCVTLKPSSYSPNVSAVIEDMISKTFDHDYISVFQGNREINAILLDQKFDHIFFTGSIKVGKIVMKKAAESLTPVTLEMGGKSPCIIDKNVDIKKTAKRIVWGKTINSGQTCIAPDYVLVHKDVKDQLVSEMIKAKKVLFGEDMINNDDFGKIIRPQAFDSLIDLIKDQTVLSGGDYDKQRQKIALTFLDEPALDSPVMQREIFGPILPIISVEDMGEAEAIIRQYEKPLALYLFTKDKKVEQHFIQSVHFGGGCVNDTVMHIANGNMPFGGIGQSGMGSYHASQGFATFTHTKSILKQNFLFDLPIRYAPYKSKLKLIKLLIK
jgi:aldehyde dehydrogenase (NAD+)